MKVVCNKCGYTIDEGTNKWEYLDTMAGFPHCEKEKVVTRGGVAPCPMFLQCGGELFFVDNCGRVADSRSIGFQIGFDLNFPGLDELLEWKAHPEKANEYWQNMPDWFPTTHQSIS